MSSWNLDITCKKPALDLSYCPCLEGDEFFHPPAERSEFWKHFWARGTAYWTLFEKANRWCKSIQTLTGETDLCKLLENQCAKRQITLFQNRITFKNINFVMLNFNLIRLIIIGTYFGDKVSLLFVTGWNNRASTN